jgi:hypothetical protein
VADPAGVVVGDDVATLRVGAAPRGYRRAMKGVCSMGFAAPRLAPCGLWRRRPLATGRSPAEVWCYGWGVGSVGW